MSATTFRSCSNFDTALHKSRRPLITARKGEIKIMKDDEVIAPEGEATQRLDKWLWFARLAKTRSLAQKLVQDGRVRVNRERTRKPAQTLRVGDIVSVEIGERLRLLEVLAPGSRRGPASEAAMLMRDLAPAPTRPPSSSASGGEPGAGVPMRDGGTGRPTKLDRRRLDRLRE
jgi:ribosome-associated heat shock protein Hsp15